MSYYKNFADGKHLQEKNIDYQELLKVQDEFESQRNRLVFDFIPPKESLKLLEIGSGRGLFARECQKRKIEYFGIEPEQKLYEQLKSDGYNIKQNFVPPVPFEKDFFDIVCHFHVLEHMETPKKAYQFISECKRILKNNGLLIFRCPNVLTWGMDFWDVDYTHQFPTTPTNVKQLLYDCGFEIIHFEEISFFKPRHFGKFRYIVPRKSELLNKIYPKISKFLGRFFKKDTELLFVCSPSHQNFNFGAEGQKESPEARPSENYESGVVLINPKSGIENPLLPLGLAYISAILEKNKISNKAIDADALNLSDSELEKKLLEIKPDIIGVSMMTATFYPSQQVIKMIRKILPKAVIIASGAHPSALPEETLKKIPELDIVIYGEGELTLLELVKTLKNNKNSSLNQIKGIYYKQEGQIFCTPAREPIENLDELPFPNRDKFPLEKYKTHPPYGIKNPYMHLITSRGCPYSCAFCSKAVFGRKLRLRSAQNVADEIEEIISKYGVKEIKFYDDDFTLDMKRAEQICDEIIKRKIKIPWSCTTRVDLVNQELLKKMKKAGCWLISYGVESSSQELLDSINKGITIEQIKRTFEWTKQAKIKILAYFMLGLPGETEKSVRDSIEFSKELNPDFVNWSLTTIFPKTPLMEIVKEKAKTKGRIIPYSSISKDVFRLNWDQEPLFLYEENIAIEKLKQYITQAYKEFYLRPKYIFSQILKIRSFTELIYYSKAFFNMLKTLY